MEIKKYFLLLLFLLITMSISAKFVQEVELKDGTILTGYVYRQQPGKYMVFHADGAKKDPKMKFMQHDKDYTLQWKDVKYIRRSPNSDASWCEDKVTLKNGTSYIGQIEEQEVGVSMTIRLSETGKKVVVSNSDLKLSEKVVTNTDKDLWYDRAYTNQLLMTDNSIRQGLIVLQYRGAKTTDCYVELLHASGFKECLFLPDIKEYIIKLE